MSDNTKEKVNLKFEEVGPEVDLGYSAGCSGGRSYCCTRECTRAYHEDPNRQDSLEAWDKYFEQVSGVIMY